MDRMKAVLIRGKGFENVAVEDVPVPGIGDDDVLIRVRMAGVHPHDYEMVRDLGTHGHTPEPMPHIPGAEIAGEIEATGGGVSSVKKGDRVILYHRIHDGTCDLCRKGHENLCRHGGRFGVNANGGFAEYMAVPSRNVVRIPESMEWERAASVPASFLTPYHALHRAGLASGQSVAVFGATGNTGMFTIQIAKKMGATVFAISRKKPEWLGKLGADYVLSPEECAERISEITGGKMCDVVLDPIGKATWEKSLGVTGTLGKWVTYGEITGAMLDLPVISLYRYERMLIGSRGGTKADVEKAVSEFSDFTVRTWKVFDLKDGVDAIRAISNPERDGRVFIRP